jgi:glycosyltransferase involved in cell wall biosynthesis
MRKPILTIFYQFDPWCTSIGGIQTFIRSFVKYAPSEFEVRLVGTVDDTHGLTGSWQEAELEGRAIHFMPLLTLPKDNFKSLVPSTVKYTVALLGRCFASDFMHFYRLEPTLATFRWSGEKMLFIQNDIQKQMNPSVSKEAILWQRFPAGYFALERLLIGQFTQILSCNTASVEFYRQRYPALADRVTYLKNTVDNELFYPLTLEEREQGRRILARQLGLAEDKRFILFAGRLHAQKDPVLLVRSIAALNAPDGHLLIVGEGDLGDEVRSEICRLGLSEQVTMLGPLGQTELAQLQRICNVLVLTSAYEGLPFVALEALACGTPVVTTQAGETPNLLCTGSGLVVRERTPVAIADALRQVLLHPDDYPGEACVQAAEPYSARTVLGAVYSDMLRRWEQRNPLSSVQIGSTTFT